MNYHMYIDHLLLSLARFVYCVVQLQKRKQIAESMREMNRENVAKLAAREKQKLKDAEEEKRLMEAYRERLDRQERRGGVSSHV